MILILCGCNSEIAKKNLQWFQSIKSYFFTPPHSRYGDATSLVSRRSIVGSSYGGHATKVASHFPDGNAAFKSAGMGTRDGLAPLMVENRITGTN